MNPMLIQVILHRLIPKPAPQHQMEESILIIEALKHFLEILYRGILIDLPNGPNGTVITLYYAANLANGTGGTGGDNIIFASKSGTMMGGGNPLSVSITGKKNISCFGGMDGSATATAAGGSTPYSYAWSNGETTNQLSNVGFGSYRITVTDNVGATASTSVALTQPSQLNHVVQITRNVSCPGGRDGAVTTSVSGGATLYHCLFLWQSEWIKSRSIYGYCNGQ